MNQPEKRQPIDTGTLHTAGCRVGPRRAGKNGSTVAALVGALLLGACASSHAPSYVEPPKAAASAKVRVVNTRPFAYYADIAIFDAASCFDKADLGMTGGNSRDDERIGMLDDKPPSASSIERHVRAGEPLVIGPRAVFPTASVDDILHALTPDAQEHTRARQAGVCKMPSFVPGEGEQYEVIVDLTPAHCSVKPYRLVDASGSVQREEVKTQPSQISTYEFDMKCFK
jgi:hypothetical protein